MSTAAEDRLRELADIDPEALGEAMNAIRGRIFVPHPHQIPILESKARFRTLAAGRRFGKTKVGARIISQRARTKPDSMNWWIANSYRNVRRGYKEVVRQTPPELLSKPAPVSTSTDLILSFKNGASMEFYSAGNADALAGEGVDFVVMDEGGLIEDRVWNQLVRPTLMDKLGEALLISTPRGHNWFYKAWLKGQEGDPAYASWQFSQADNPYIDPAETEEVRKELPEILYRQEILAEFLAGGASIFGGGVAKEGAVMDMLMPPAGQVYIGVDLADKEDFTVVSGVRESDHRPCIHERFNQLGWPTQKEQIADIVRETEALAGVDSVTVMVDSTGVGDVVFEDLQFMGVDVIGQKFSNEWKEKAVKLLAADLERGRAFIHADAKKEFENYEFTMTDAGRYKFAASGDGHDDEVSAKLLEHWALHHEGPPEISEVSEQAEEAAKVDTGLPANAGEDGAEADSWQDIMNRADAWR